MDIHNSDSGIIFQLINEPSDPKKLETTKKIKNNFFISVWIVFLLLFVAYSIYLLVESTDLAKINNPSTDQIVTLVSFKVILGVYFFISVINIKKIINTKTWLPLIVLAGLISRVILIPSTPVLEDDYYRYMWDGAVTANGINPFKYSPLEVEKDSIHIPEELVHLKNESGKIFENINHRHIRTIYPMLAQFTFAAAYFISPWQTWSWKLILLLFDLLLLIVLLRLLKFLKMPLIFISFYWLNPILLHEFYSAAHMDLLALPFVVLSLFSFIKKKQSIAIVLLAIATGFKVWPLVLLPFYIREIRSDKKLMFKTIAFYFGITIILFIPVMISGIDNSLGFVRYAEAWVNNSAFYNLFSELIKWIVSTIGLSFSYNYLLPRIGVGIIYFIILHFIIRKRSEDNFSFFEKALLIVAILFLISPAQFPWYYTWIVPLLVIRPKAALLFYPVLLPLYNLNYISNYFIYLQHLPVILFFMWELKTQKMKKYFEFRV